MIDLDRYQALVGEVWGALHPDETIADIGCSLGEETGEVLRAITKRNRNSSRSDDWDRELRHETVDALVNLLAVAWKEGYSLAGMLVERWPHYAAKVGSCESSAGVADLGQHEFGHPDIGHVGEPPAGGAVDA